MTEPNSEPAPAPAEEPAPTSAILPLMRLLPPPPVGTILTPPTDAHDPTRRGWFVGQMWAEVRLAAQMYFDPRYRISRTAQVAFPLVAALLMFNYFLFGWWLPVVPVVSPIAERLLDALIVVFAYRVLLRELDRYRAVLDYLARFTAR